jgi:hypothetical protein
MGRQFQNVWQPTGNAIKEMMDEISLKKSTTRIKDLQIIVGTFTRFINSENTKKQWLLGTGLSSFLAAV